MLIKYDPSRVNEGTEHSVKITLATTYESVECSRSFIFTITGNYRGLELVEQAIDRLVENTQDNERLSLLQDTGLGSVGRLRRIRIPVTSIVDIKPYIKSIIVGVEILNVSYTISRRRDVM
jgi:hypothetical protein